MLARLLAVGAVFLAVVAADPAPTDITSNIVIVSTDQQNYPLTSCSQLTVALTDGTLATPTYANGACTYAWTRPNRLEERLPLKIDGTAGPIGVPAQHIASASGIQQGPEFLVAAVDPKNTKDQKFAVAGDGLMTRATSTVAIRAGAPVDCTLLSVKASTILPGESPGSRPSISLIGGTLDAIQQDTARGCVQKLTGPKGQPFYLEFGSPFGTPKLLNGSTTPPAGAFGTAQEIVFDGKLDMAPAEVTGQFALPKGATDCSQLTLKVTPLPFTTSGLSTNGTTCRFKLTLLPGPFTMYVSLTKPTPPATAKQVYMSTGTGKADTPLEATFKDLPG